MDFIIICARFFLCLLFLSYWYFDFAYCVLYLLFIGRFLTSSVLCFPTARFKKWQQPSMKWNIRWSCPVDFIKVEHKHVKLNFPALIEYFAFRLLLEHTFPYFGKALKKSFQKLTLEKIKTARKLFDLLASTSKRTYA